MVKCASSVVLAVTFVLAGGVGAAFGQESHLGDSRWSGHPQGGNPGGVPWRLDLYPAFLQACRERKPLIVYFHCGYCAECRGVCVTRSRLENEAFRSPAFAALADAAIFVWQDAEKDDSRQNVATLMKKLNVDSSPWIAVLDVSPSAIVEVGRIAGYYPTNEFRWGWDWSRSPAGPQRHGKPMRGAPIEPGPTLHWRPAPRHNGRRW
jgi:hypothetical protein